MAQLFLSRQAYAYYLERAKGGAGIIIPGVLSVDYPTGKTTGCQPRLDDPKYVAGWYRLAKKNPCFFYSLALYLRSSLCLKLNYIIGLSALL